MPRALLAALAAAVILVSTETRADPGLSYLALCQRTWPCATALSAFNNTDTIRVGWIEGTFGRTCSCANTLLQDPRPKVIRVHLANGSCLRQGTCGRYEVFYRQTVASANRRIKQGNRLLLGRFTAEAKRLAKRLKVSSGPLTCYVSPVLESDLDQVANAKLAAIAAKYLPGCRLVDNPRSGACRPGVVCETHGLFPRLSAPCIADLDGATVSDSDKADFLQRTSSCDISFIWTPEMNCNNSSTLSRIDPRNRVCEQSASYHTGLSTWLPPAG